MGGFYPGELNSHRRYFRRLSIWRAENFAILALPCRDTDDTPISTIEPVANPASAVRPRCGHASGMRTLEDAGDPEAAILSSSKLAQDAINFSHQAEKLSHKQPRKQRPGSPPNVAIEAQFVTPQDPVIVTSEGKRLPGVPLQEAHKLNVLRERLQSEQEHVSKLQQNSNTEQETIKATESGSASKTPERAAEQATRLQATPSHKSKDTLRRQMPPSHTHPLFPPLPLYGPPTLLRNVQCLFFRVSAFFLSLAFLGVVVTASLVSSLVSFLKRTLRQAVSHDLRKRRPFYAEERRRQAIRDETARSWEHRTSTRSLGADAEGAAEAYPLEEGGKDALVCDVGYYARRVGLDVETFEVQTEDGFIIELWHVYDPQEQRKMDKESREDRGPMVFRSSKKKPKTAKKPKFPVLLMHGLLQSSGAYCCNDNDSLAFWLCRSGFDVWLGNNRCGFRPRHVLLQYGDPRMWCWNIRQMGVFDLPALTSRVLFETGFEKIGLICHSQGTTEALVALAKEQRPELGEKLTVFCALAPAAYPGLLIGKAYFKFMRMISPGLFRLMFGIHAFIPFMMQMHSLLPPRLYGWLGYNVFSFLFNWSDERWDRGLRDRMFQFAPVYVSAESMRWWLGREGFAKHECILTTKEVTRAEEIADALAGDEQAETPRAAREGAAQAGHVHQMEIKAWYNDQAPPFALWIAGNDDLVDGRKLLQRFENGREPHVDVVHSKVIAGYEHLDVIWAMDAPEQVFKEIREVLWKTCDVRDKCRVPQGCEHLEVEVSRGEDGSSGSAPETIIAS